MVKLEGMCVCVSLGVGCPSPLSLLELGLVEGLEPQVRRPEEQVMVDARCDVKETMGFLLGGGSGACVCRAGEYRVRGRIVSHRRQYIVEV